MSNSVHAVRGDSEQLWSIEENVSLWTGTGMRPPVSPRGAWLAASLSGHDDEGEGVSELATGRCHNIRLRCPESKD